MMNVLYQSCIAAVYCLVILDYTIGTRVKSGSSTFHKVDERPSEQNNIKTISGTHHLRQCMKECLLSEACLTTVYHEHHRQCSLYNSSSLTNVLSESEKAVRKDVAHLEVKEPCLEDMQYNIHFDGCLKLFTSGKNRADAEAECQSIHERCHLVAITDEAKQLVVNQMADSAGIEYVYTSGFAVAPASSTFVWKSTDEELTYTNWGPGEPHNSENTLEECLINSKETPFRWIDVHCSMIFPYMCEFK